MRHEILLLPVMATFTDIRPQAEKALKEDERAALNVYDKLRQVGFKVDFAVPVEVNGHTEIYVMLTKAGGEMDV